MIYYKKLDLDHQIVSKKTLSYIQANRSKFKAFWTWLDFDNFVSHVPEVVSMFAPLNITPRVASIIIVANRLSNPVIHRDHTEVPIRINIPILNCECSQTKFWKTTLDPIIEYVPGTKIPYLSLTDSECELADTLVLDCPTVMRIGEPHSVHPGEKTPRISLTIEFYEDIEHLLN